MTKSQLIQVLHEREKSESESDDVSLNEASKTVKYKRARGNKGSCVFNETQIIQILNNQQQAQNNNPASPNNTSTLAHTESNVKENFFFCICKASN